MIHKTKFYKKNDLKSQAHWHPALHTPFAPYKFPLHGGHNDHFRPRGPSYENASPLGRLVEDSYKASPPLYVKVPSVCYLAPQALPLVTHFLSQTRGPSAP